MGFEESHGPNIDGGRGGKNVTVNLCQAEGMLGRSPKPEVHSKVLDYNPDRIGIWKCW